MTNPFQIGQAVFVADAHSYSEEREPCPVCFGKLSVTVILGNGEVEVDGYGIQLEDNKVFPTWEEANDRREILHEKAEEQARRNFEHSCTLGRKQTTWTVGYHRSAIKDLERKLEWHKSKLNPSLPDKVNA